jgi:hypothetical protein
VLFVVVLSGANTPTSLPQFLVIVLVWHPCSTLSFPCSMLQWPWPRPLLGARPCLHPPVASGVCHHRKPPCPGPSVTEERRSRTGLTLMRFVWHVMRVGARPTSGITEEERHILRILCYEGCAECTQGRAWRQGEGGAWPSAPSRRRFVGQPELRALAGSRLRSNARVAWNS